MKTAAMLFLAGAILTGPLNGQYKSDLINTSEGDLEMFFIGHGTLMFTFNDLVIHIDPVMREADYSTMPDADLILVVIDVAQPDTQAERFLVKRLRAQNKPVVMALNKIDLVEKSSLLESIEKWADTYQFRDMVPISAKNGVQIDELILAMVSALPQGPPSFPNDTLTDVSERFLAAEMIREQVFRLTGEEIPYATAVTVDAFKEQNRGNLVKIEATIHLERDSQTGIVICKRGSKLKQIGTRSREQIERLLGTKVYLKLFVRVQKNWRKDTKAIRKFGY